MVLGFMVYRQFISARLFLSTAISAKSAQNASRECGFSWPAERRFLAGLRSASNGRTNRQEQPDMAYSDSTMAALRALNLFPLVNNTGVSR
jgi:hypothetical protein